MIPHYLHLRFFPLKKGNYWELATESEGQQVVIRIEVEERQNMPAGIMYRLRYSMDGEPIMVENLLVDHQGIWVHSRFIEGTMFLYDPPFPVLPSNYRDLKWWNWEGTVGTVESRATMIYQGNAHVNLEGDDEPVLSIKVKISEENKYGTSSYLRYYGEHLGPVKEIAETQFYSYEAILVSAEVEYDDYSYIEELEKRLAMLAQETLPAETEGAGETEEAEESEEIPDELPEEIEIEEDFGDEDLELPETIELDDTLFEGDEEKE